MIFENLDGSVRYHEKSSQVIVSRVSSKCLTGRFHAALQIHIFRLRPYINDKKVSLCFLSLVKIPSCEHGEIPVQTRDSSEAQNDIRPATPTVPMMAKVNKTWAPSSGCNQGGFAAQNTVIFS